MAKIQDLLDRQRDLLDGMNAVQAKADEEQRDLTDDEAEHIENAMGELETIKADIARRERLEQLNASLGQPRGRKADPEPGAVRPKVEPQAVRDPGKGGFKAFGEFAKVVRAACRPGNPVVDPRLIANAAASTYGSEGTDADGGFAVPPDFRGPIMSQIMGGTSLLARCDQLTTGTNSITVPTDETTPWQTSGGILANWEGEAAQIPQSKPALKSVTTRLAKLTALVPVTDELLEDVASLGSYISAKVPMKFNSKFNTAILSGTGTGMPLGILDESSPMVVPTVTVAGESGQASNQVLYKNIVNMWGRLYAGYRTNAAWFVHPDVETSLQLMEFPTTTGATAVPVYLPPGGASASPYALLFGRPVVPIEECQALGTRGDIVLADLRQYMAVLKAGGIRQDVSIHLFFDYGETAFRFIMRMGGKPWWASSIAPANGSTTRSCFVALEDRTGTPV